MSTKIQELVGQTVDVWTVQGQHETRDSGVLRGVDERWLVLEKDGEMLFFGVARVRLVKLRP